MKYNISIFFNIYLMSLVCLRQIRSYNQWKLILTALNVILYL